MPRAPRINASETIYHLITRGNRREPIVADDCDRETFMTIAGDVIERFELVCIEYCLMTNHYHLLVETADANLSAAMERLNGSYARSFNRRHGFCGHVFERRFASIVPESNEHLLEMCRYIALNPVKARICAFAEQWEWSSYPVVLGLQPAPDFFRPEPLLSYFDADPDRAREEFRRQVEEARDTLFDDAE